MEATQNAEAVALWMGAVLRRIAVLFSGQHGTTDKYEQELHPMWYCFFDTIPRLRFGIERTEPSPNEYKKCATFNEAKEWVARRLRERRAEAMRPVIAIDAELAKLAAMKEPK